MTHRRSATATLFAIAAVLAGCTPEPAPPKAEGPVLEAAATEPGIATVGYACESGRVVSARYPDLDTVQIDYEGKTSTLKVARSASGARYAGGGLEWWTATRDGQESATLSRIGPNDQVGTAVLERCSRPTAGSVVAPGPAPVVVPVPASTGVGGTTCKGPQLRLSAEGGDAGMGNRVAIIGVTNTGTRSCVLSGYPTVTLQDARNRDLTTIRADQSPGSYLRTNEAPAPVTLQPQGKGYFDMAWNVVPNEGNGETTCPSAARLRMTVPDDTAVITLGQAFTPCGGRIRISPFRSEAEPTPRSAG